jgi:hypothetical protein
MSCLENSHRDLDSIICLDCKQKWWNYSCVPCLEPWKYCFTCCEQIAKASKYIISQEYYKYYRIVSFCEYQHEENKKKYCQEWISNSVGVVFYFFTAIFKKSFPKVLVEYLIPFLSPKDGFALTRAILTSIFRGFYLENFNPFLEPFFSTVIMTYYHLEFDTLERQLGELLKFDKRYLFSLFSVSHFQTVFFTSCQSLARNIKKTKQTYVTT